MKKVDEDQRIAIKDLVAPRNELLLEWGVEPRETEVKNEGLSKVTRVGSATEPTPCRSCGGRKCFASSSSAKLLTRSVSLRLSKSNKKPTAIVCNLRKFMKNSGRRENQSRIWGDQQSEKSRLSAGNSPGSILAGPMSE